MCLDMCLDMCSDMYLDSGLWLDVSRHVFRPVLQNRFSPASRYTLRHVFSPVFRHIFDIHFDMAPCFVQRLCWVRDTFPHFHPAGSRSAVGIGPGVPWGLVPGCRGDWSRGAVGIGSMGMTQGRWFWFSGTFSNRISIWLRGVYVFEVSGMGLSAPWLEDRTDCPLSTGFWPQSYKGRYSMHTCLYT